MGIRIRRERAGSLKEEGLKRAGKGFRAKSGGGGKQAGKRGGGIKG